MYNDDFDDQPDNGAIFGNEYVLTPARLHKRQQIDWLWTNRIPFGEVTLLEGDPGIGKSMLTAALAAAVTGGKSLPGEEPLEPASAIIASLEDHPEAVIRPRLEAAGADLDRAMLINMLDHRSWDRPLRLPEDLTRLDDMLQRTHAALLVIDPLMAVLGRDINSDRDQDVREALGPLGEIARSHRTAILIVRHLNKAVGKSAIYRGGGSIGIGGLARSALLLSKHPHERDRIILTQTKSNLGARAKGVIMSIATEDGVGRIIWEGEDDLTSDEVLSEQAKGTTRNKATKRSEIERWLSDILADGPVPAKEVEALAEEAGYSGSMLRKVKDSLGIRADRTGFGANGAWMWTLMERGSSKGSATQGTLHAIDVQTAPGNSTNGHLSHLKPLWRNAQDSEPIDA
jgi:putative DNA primase/helicase